jgi:uncharacterized integral membrane protein (TIGR00697 family)
MNVQALREDMKEFLKTVYSYCFDTESVYNGHKYQRLISMIYITILMAATVSAYKIIYIFSIPEPGSTLIYTSSYFVGSLISELYGPDVAKKIILETVACGFLFALLVTFIDHLPTAAIFLDHSKDYHNMLGNTLRFTVSGCIGYVLSAYINVHLVSRWRILLNNRYFLIRSLAGSAIGELVATFVAGILTFLWMMPLNKILYLMTNAFLFKIGYDPMALT